MFTNRSIIQPVLTIWLAFTITFLMLRLLPGDIVSEQLGLAGASDSQIQARQVALGLDQSLVDQYVTYVYDLLQGDLGVSLASGLPVFEMIVTRFQTTLLLSMASLVLATVLGFVLGTLATSTNDIIALLGQLPIVLSFSVPIYWTATIVLLVFAVELNWLPSSGNETVFHYIMPVTLLGYHSCGAIAQIVRTSITQHRQANFVAVARSKGLRERYIFSNYIIRPGLIPVISVIALQSGFLLSGTVITEAIFSQPGIGNLLLTSTLNQDYPVVQGVALIITTIYIAVNALADGLFALADPRANV
jgi:ABC-type dipeptide/oligopeptide/nickel transport system permease component